MTTTTRMDDDDDDDDDGHVQATSTNDMNNEQWHLIL